MTPVLAATLSISDKIQTYGAYAGFAAVLGLAALALLYFAQAREVKRLREWAGRAPERAAELEARVAADAQRRGTVQARPRQAAPGQPLPPAQPAGQPVTPPAAGAAAGAGGPVTPRPGIPAQPGQAVTVAGQPVTPAGQGAAGAAAQSARPGQPGTPGQQPGQPARPDGSQAPPSGSAPAGPSAPLPNGAGVAGDAAAAVRPSGAARPAQPLRTPVIPSASPRTEPAGARRREPAPPTRSPARTVLAILGAVVVVVVAGVLVATQVLGGGSGQKPTNNIGSRTTPANPSGGGGAKRTSPPSRASTTVVVLNGTPVRGLAGALADKIRGAGFTSGPATNAADSQRSATIVSYASQRYRAQAEAVAQITGVGSDAIQPMDATTRTTAGPEANVVVTIGADQAQ